MEKFLTLTVSGAVSGAIFSLIAAGPRAVVQRDRHLQLLVRRDRVHERVPLLPAQLGPPLADRARRGVRDPGVRAAVRPRCSTPRVFRPLARATESAKIMATVGLLIAHPGPHHVDQRPVREHRRVRHPAERRRHPGRPPSGHRAQPEGRLEAARATSRSTPTSSWSSSPRWSSRSGSGSSCATRRSACRCARSSTGRRWRAPAASTSAPRRATRG